MVEFIGTAFISNKKLIKTEHYYVEKKIELNRDLITKLEKLPAEANVGIECTPEFIKNKESDYLSEFIGDNELYIRTYWDKIVKKCKERNLNVIYLANNDDYVKLNEESKKWTYFDEFQQGVELDFETMRDFEVENDKGEKYKLPPCELEEIHKNRFYYWKFIKIPDNIFQKVKETNPDLVILSKKTLEYFIQQRPNVVDYSEIKIRGIKVEETDRIIEKKVIKNGETGLDTSIKSKLVRCDLNNYKKSDDFDYGYRQGDRQIIIDEYLATSDIIERC